MLNMKGAIFDVDGTLLDSMALWDALGSSYLQSLGIAPHKNLNTMVRSMSLYQAACYYQSEYGVTLSTAEIIAGISTMIEQYYRYEVQLKAGAFDFLAFLHRRGVKMCIATATEGAMVEAALRRLHINDFFTEIFTCTSVECGKDQPEIFERALSHLGTQKSETLVFEDALHAVKTAKSAGFRVAAVYDTYEPSTNTVSELSDYYFYDFYQAKELLSL